MEESAITATVLATAQLNHFAGAAQHSAADKAIARAKGWLAQAPLKSQEDRVMALWGMHELGFDAQKVDSARQTILKLQRADGGWGQLDSMESDAYATGQSLFVLLKTGLAQSDPAAGRAIEYLLHSQRPDGSWHVNTRSKPIQPYFDFDDEDPHQRHQFISLPATCWSAAALASATTPASAPTAK
jgi:N-acyl-D-amino-acid deacylase